MQEEFLYKSKNTKEFIILSIVYCILAVGVAIAMYFFKLNYFSDLTPSFSFNNPFDWMPCLLILLALLIIMGSIHSYFSNYLGIVKDGIIIKQNRKFEKILFENIKLIKKYYTKHYAYTLIKMKNGKEVYAPDIKDLKEFTKRINILYPAFCNYEGIVQSYDEDIRRTSVSGIILLLLAMYYSYKIFDKNMQSTAVQVFVGGLVILYIWAFGELAKLIKPLKNRYFSIETKMMLNSIKASQDANLNKLKEQEYKLMEEEKESIVTNYCPMCGSQLIDFKCDRCEVNLDNIYDVKKFYCINCGTKRKDLEPECLNCGMVFNL